MAPDLILLVLAAALLHALWNSLVKAGQDRLVSIVVIVLTGGAVSLPALFLLPAPGLASVPFLAGSVTTHTIYYYFLINAYRTGDLSRVYPLARGLAPPLVAIGAALASSEWLSAREVAGLVLVSIGIASLVRGTTAAGDRRAVRFAVATGGMIAVYSIIDGLGGRAATTPLSYIAAMNVGEAIGLVATARLRRGPALWPAVRTALPHGLAAGVMATLGYGIVIYAMSRGAMAHVSALRESSVVIAALIGTLVLGEPGTGRRVGAALVVVAGVLVMNW